MLHEEGQRFQVALDALSRSHGDLLKRGIDAAKQLFIHAARLVQVTMESHLVFNAGPFLYFTIPEVSFTDICCKI